MLALLIIDNFLSSHQMPVKALSVRGPWHNYSPPYFLGLLRSIYFFTVSKFSFRLTIIFWFFPLVSLNLFLLISSVMFIVSVSALKQYIMISSFVYTCHPHFNFYHLHFSSSNFTFGAQIFSSLWLKHLLRFNYFYEFIVTVYQYFWKNF